MRIALATVGTTGDVRPFAILARELAERGHDVLAVSWPLHARAFTDAGIRFEAAGPDHGSGAIDAVALAAAGRNPMEQVKLLRDFHLADGVAHYRRLRTLLAGHDLVVIHGIHSLAHAVVLDLDARWASVMFDPVLLRTPGLPPPGVPNLGPLNPLLWDVLERMLAGIGSPLDAVLAKAGSAQRRLPLFRARSPRCHVIACSPSVMRMPDRLPPGVAVTGALVDPSPVSSLPDEAERFLADGPPPIAITFGSMRGIPNDTTTEVARRLAEAGRRVIVQGAANGTSASAGILRIGAVDHRALFPRCALVVHHAGAGTAHAVAHAGVPSVSVPHIGDQAYWADRLHRLGCSPRPVALRQAVASRIVERVGEGIEPSIRRACADLQGRMAREDGLTEAIGLLEGAATG